MAPGEMTVRDELNSRRIRTLDAIEGALWAAGVGEEETAAIRRYLRDKSEADLLTALQTVRGWRPGDALIQVEV